MRCRLWLYLWLCLRRFIRAATSAVSTCNAAETASKEEVSPPRLSFAQKLRQLGDICRDPPDNLRPVTFTGFLITDSQDHGSGKRRRHSLNEKREV